MGDPNAGYFEIYTTTDGGNDWERTPQANIAPQLSGEFGITSVYTAHGDSTLWFGTNLGRIYKTIDRGLNWTVASTPYTGSYIGDIAFKDALNGIASNGSPGPALSDVIRTTDGGATWSLVATNTANIFTFGNGVANTDYTVNFTGTTNSGVFTWMEDEDYFQFSDDILFPDNESVKFGTGVDASIHYDGTNLIINPKAVGSGILDVSGTLQTDGYNSADGTSGATADVATLAPDGTTTRTLHFKNGLYTGYTDS